MQRSVGRTGVCWDNAVAEAFFAALKNDFYHRYTWPTRARARFAVAEYIEVFYNRRRGTPASATAPPRKPSPTTVEQHKLLDQQRDELSKILDTAQ